MFNLLKPNMCKEDILLQQEQIVLLLKNSSQKAKQANLLISMNVNHHKGPKTTYKRPQTTTYDQKPPANGHN